MHVNEEQYFKKLHQMLYDIEELRKTQAFSWLNDKTNEFFEEAQLLKHTNLIGETKVL